jgi:hypothetical protein
MERKRAGDTQTVAAAKAGISERSARRLDREPILPSQRAVRPRGRTRRDPLDGVWDAEVVAMLRSVPFLRATTILEDLQSRHPGRFADGVLRTLQRRIAHWRATEGPEFELIFRQEHPPGHQADLADFRRAGRAVAGIQVENLQQRALEDQASLDRAKASAEQARLKYESQIGGVNTKVASIEAELAQARFYLDNTTLVAPEDGYVFNLQVRPGMVSGIVRFGAIASFVVDADRYVLATFFQENLKYVKKGQPVELAMDLYPGQIFPGTVQAIGRGSGAD